MPVGLRLLFAADSTAAICLLLLLGRLRRRRLLPLLLFLLALLPLLLLLLVLLLVVALFALTLELDLSTKRSRQIIRLNNISWSVHTITLARRMTSKYMLARHT